MEEKRSGEEKSQKPFQPLDPPADMGANKNHHHTVNTNVNSLRGKKNWKIDEIDDRDKKHMRNSF